MPQTHFIRNANRQKQIICTKIITVGSSKLEEFSKQKQICSLEMSGAEKREIKFFGSPGLYKCDTLLKKQFPAVLEQRFIPASSSSQKCLVTAGTYGPKAASQIQPMLELEQFMNKFSDILSLSAKCLFGLNEPFAVCQRMLFEKQ